MTDKENANGSEATKIVPPYVPYKTLKNFIDSLKVSIPSRIDRSVMSSMSGATQSQLTSALRYLGLISPVGIPTERLTNLVHSEGQEQKKLLRDMLKHSYPFLFQDFDLARGTGKQFEEKFTATGMSGETAKKSMTFFIAAAKDAELAMSPHIKPYKGLSKPPATRMRRSPAATNGDATSPQQEDMQQPAGMTWAQLLLSKFPSFDPAWPDDVKAKWFSAFDQLMQQGVKKGFE